MTELGKAAVGMLLYLALLARETLREGTRPAEPFTALRAEPFAERERRIRDELGEFNVEQEERSGLW